MAEQFNQLFAIRATGSGVDDSFVATRTLIIFDALTFATNAGAGTVTIRNGATAITSAMNPGASDTTIARPTTIDDAQNTVASGSTINFDVSAATLNYECYAYIFPPGIAG